MRQVWNVVVLQLENKNNHTNKTWIDQVVLTDRTNFSHSAKDANTFDHGTKTEKAV